MGLLYHLEKPFANIFIGRIFYKLGSEGRETIAKGVPVILAPNHENAFIDPVVTAMILKPKVRFFARGDVFKGKLARFFLNAFNISPMYRIQEGYSELKKNDKTFQECYERLGKNEALLMFPEGLCIWGRRPRPLKKGLARIVFQTEENWDFKKEILIFPVGLNYTDIKKFRSHLYIHFGKPISTTSFHEAYRENRVKAINDFTKHLEVELSRLQVNIKNPENDRLVEGIEAMHMYEWLQPGQSEKSVRDRYYASREIAEMVNQLEEREPQKLNELRVKVVNYIRRVRGNELRDHLLRPETINKMNIGHFFLEYAIIYFGMLLYIPALITNYLPYYWPKLVTHKTVKSEEFYASVYSTLFMLTWMIYYGLQLLVIALVFRSWLLLGISALLIPFLGSYAIYFYPRMKKIFGRWKLLRMVRKDKQIVQELLSERSSLIQELDILKKEFKQRNPEQI